MGNKYVSLGDYLASPDKQDVENGFALYVKQFGAASAASEAWEHVSFKLMGHEGECYDEFFMTEARIEFVHGWLRLSRWSNDKEVYFAYGYKIGKEPSNIHALLTVDDVKAWFINIFTNFLKEYYHG